MLIVSALTAAVALYSAATRRQRAQRAPAPSPRPQPSHVRLIGPA